MLADTQSSKIEETMKDSRPLEPRSRKASRELEVRQAAGRFIKSLILSRRSTIKQFSYEHRISAELMSRVLNGRKKIDSRIADVLASAFGEDQEYWLSLEQYIASNGELPGYPSATDIPIESTSSASSSHDREPDTVTVSIGDYKVALSIELPSEFLFAQISHFIEGIKRGR
jgi:plasmid maintenance system antidote protein VapI